MLLVYYSVRLTKSYCLHIPEEGKYSRATQGRDSMGAIVSSEAGISIEDSRTMAQSKSNLFLKLVHWSSGRNDLHNIRCKQFCSSCLTCTFYANFHLHTVVQLHGNSQTSTYIECGFSHIHAERKQQVLSRMNLP